MQLQPFKSCSGGRFGEMSTLMNYMQQSFNFKGRIKLKPYHDLIANIATEELGHIEMVSVSINSLLNGPRQGENAQGEPFNSPFEEYRNLRNTHHFIVGGNAALVTNSMGQPWRGDYVFASGNLILDLLHNFFLKNGARTQKLRVYEMTKNPAARAMLGYLLVRGGVHALAYAKALESLTGVEMSKMLPIPNIENSKFPEAREWEKHGGHRQLYRFSPEDYRDVSKIWAGASPDGSGQLEVVDGPPEGSRYPEYASAPENFVPEYQPEEIFEIAQKLVKKM
jgi:Mn-containing catalase